MVGTITLIGLCRLGVGMWRQPVSELATRLAPWTRAGLVVMMITGGVLFLSDATRYGRNTAFRFKIAFLLLALLVQPQKGKRAAFLSLILWTCVVITGRAIADFDI